MDNKTIETNLKKNTKKYEEYLDSDDEFPFEYNEIPSLPLYKNDNRFDKIIFKWINNQESHHNKSFKTDVPLAITNDEDTRKDFLSHSKNAFEEITNAVATRKALFSNIDNTFDERLVIRNGVLSNHDLFCLKSIEECAGDSIFVWLLNFLVYKDAQSKYMFLKSCLVSTKLCNDKFYSIKKTNPLLSQTRKMYKLLIKM